MKSFKLITLLFIGILFTLNSCKKVTNPTDGVKVIVDYDLIETTFSVKFIDAKTGQLIGWDNNEQVVVKITGENADAIIDVSGLQRDSYKSINGFIELALDPDYSPSQQNPIKFTVIASKGGYLTTSKLIEVISNDNIIFEVRMVKLDDPPNGVSRIVDNSGKTDPNGEGENDIVLTTPNGMARLIIKAGTILKDSDDEPLSGQLTIDFIHFSNMEDQSLSAFPGGLRANVEMQDGSYQQVFFFSGGFIALDINDESNNYADTVLVNPMELRMKLPELTYNPYTDGGVAAGDTLPVWSYDIESGEWDYETTDTVFMDEGEYYINTEMWHLSWWNWDWWWEWICPEGLIINFTSEQYYCPCYWWRTEVRNDFNNTLMWDTYMYACENDPVRLYNAPGGIAVNLYFADNCSKIYTEEEFYYVENLCAPDELNVAFYAEQLGENVGLEITAFCASNPNFIILPTLSYWVKKWDDDCYRWFELLDGKGEMCGVELGETYEIGIYIDGEWHSHEFIVNDTLYVEHEIELPPEVCSTVFGL